MDLLLWKTCSSCKKFFLRWNMVHGIMIGVHSPWSFCKTCELEFNGEDSISYDKIDAEIHQKQRDLLILHSVIGENPLNQIDWIIEHGFEEFSRWYKSYEDGTIQKKKRDKDISELTWEDGDTLIIGGIGNRVVGVIKGGAGYEV